MNEWRNIALRYAEILTRMEELNNELLLKLAQYEDVSELEEEMKKLESDGGYHV